MSSDLQKLRAAAESYKSFPNAVAAVVQAMFDKGATQVTVSFDRELAGKPVIAISADKVVFTVEDGAASWHNAFVHHSEQLFMGAMAYEFYNPGRGEGVNPKQDRSAKRLMRELPRLLSPREAYHTVVVDETGEERRLVKDVPSTVIDGLRVSWPEKMIGFGREGLTLKFGAVRVSMKSFIEQLILDPEDHKQLALLTHPWLQGTIEIEVADPQVVDFPVPLQPADKFFGFFYESGDADQFAEAILQIVPAVVLREMGKMVMSDLGDFCNEGGELVLDRHTYKLVCVDEPEIWRLEHVVLGGAHVPSGESHTQIYLIPTHPIFRTIGPDHVEIMLVIWWQLAIWITQNQPEVFEEARPFNLRVNAIYLALREQNPERWDE